MEMQPVRMKEGRRRDLGWKSEQMAKRLESLFSCPGNLIRINNLEIIIFRSLKEGEEKEEDEH